jgi:hypothetical protein
LHLPSSSFLLSSSSVVLVASFVAVRAIAYALGLRFDASEAAAFWHFIEPELLRERLLESIFYLHSQPPLFNLWLGVYHKLFGQAMPLAFAATYLGLGVVLCVQMNTIARALGIARWPRTLAVAIFCTSPAVLLYENFLVYAYPVAVLLAWSAARFHRALESGRERDWYAFGAIVVVVVLMRSLYHPVWLALVLAASGLALRRLHGSVRALARPAFVAALLVAAVVVKNQLVFGHATLSSIGGMHLSRVVLDRMDDQEFAAWIDRGVLSPWAIIGGFQELPKYVPPPAVPPSSVPLLDRPFKADGSMNLHHRAYIEISDQLGRDSLAVIRGEPSIYLRSVWQNVMQTLHPASTYAPLAEAREQIAPLVRVYEPVLGWIPFFGAMGVWPVLLPLVLAATVAALWRQRAAIDARWLLIAYLVCNVAYVVAVGALMERSENQRFRFDVDPMIWLLVMMLLVRLKPDTGYQRSA